MSLTAVRIRETAHRVALRHLQANPALQDSIEALEHLSDQVADNVQKALEHHHREAQAIQQSDRLNDKAKKDDLDGLTGKTRATLARILGRDGLAANMTRIETEMVNSLVKARRQYTVGRDPGELLLARMDQQEARAEARREREEARQLHRAKLAAARKHREPLTDEEATFIDPVSVKFLEACRSWDQSKEPYISALESPPFGVQVLTPEIIDQGREALKAVVCRDLLEARSALAVRIDQAQEMAAIVEDALRTLPVKQEERPFMSDQERQQATA